MICLNPSIQAPDYKSLNIAATVMVHSYPANAFEIELILHRPCDLLGGAPAYTTGERAGETRWGSQINESEVRLGGRVASLVEKKSRKEKCEKRKRPESGLKRNEPLLQSRVVFLTSLVVLEVGLKKECR